MLADFIPGENTSLLADGQLLAMSSHGLSSIQALKEKKERELHSTSYKAINPITRDTLS